MFSEISEENFKNLTERDMAGLYDSIEENLFFLNTFIAKQLNSYEKNTGAHRTLQANSRIKAKGRVIEKIKNFQLDKNGKLTKHIADTKHLRTLDLLHDLVGARIVTYFSLQLKHPLRYLLSWPIFKIDKIIVYQEEKQQWLPDEIIHMLKNLSSSGEEVQFIEQKNNSKYESIHIHLKLNKNFHYFIKEELKDRFNDDIIKNKIKNGEIFEIPIEFQLRTLFQHAWAQSEHYLSYSEKKRYFSEEREDLLEQSHIEDDFFQLKQVLRSAEHMQEIIWKRYVEPNNSIQLSDDSIRFASRLSFFLKNDRKEIELHTENIERFSNKNNPTEFNKSLQNFKKLLLKVNKKYPGENLLTYEKTGNIDSWGRQRAILLFLAYLAHKAKGAEIQKIANDFIKGHFKPFAFSNTLLNSDKIYATVQLWDKEYRYSGEDKGCDSSAAWLTDPLIPYRRAHIHFVLNNPTYSIHLIEKAINDRKTQLQNGIEECPNITRLQNLNSKQAQYNWTSYLLIANNSDENLIIAIETIKNSLEDSIDRITNNDNSFEVHKDNIDIEKISMVKDYSFYTFMLFHRYIEGGKWSFFAPLRIRNNLNKNISREDFLMAWNNNDSLSMITAGGTLIYFWAQGKKKELLFFKEELSSYNLTCSLKEEKDIFFNILSLLDKEVDLESLQIDKE